MKETLSVMFASFFFILAIPLAYGQQLDTATTNVGSPTNTTTPEATIGKSENLTITDLRYR